MTEQSEKISNSAGYIKSKFPENYKPLTAIITEKGFEILKGKKVLDEVDVEIIADTNTDNANDRLKIVFARIDDTDILICNGRHHYFDGISMRNIGHMIYVLRYLGIKNIISIDEVGHLNPRFNCGETALIYDHINLAGDNPLIGVNDEELGIRFPDMSNAYDKEFYKKIYKLFQENFVRINEAVYLGTIGPQSETDAEARFYREIGSDVVGYSMVPENITSVHAGLKFIGIGLITRNLVADKMMEDDRSDKQRVKDQKDSLVKASKELEKVLQKVIKSV